MPGASAGGGQVPKWVFGWLRGSHCCPLQECYLVVGPAMLLSNRPNELTPCSFCLGIVSAASSAPELSLAWLHHDGLKCSSGMTPTPSQPLPLGGSPASSISDCPSAEPKGLLHRLYYSQAKGVAREQGPGPGFLSAWPWFPTVILPSRSRADVGEHPMGECQTGRVGTLFTCLPARALLSREVDHDSHLPLAQPPPSSASPDSLSRKGGLVLTPAPTSCSSSGPVVKHENLV